MSFTAFTFARADSLQAALWSRTVTTIAVANAIKASIATVAAPASYSTSGLNGAIGQAEFAVPQNVTVTTSSHGGSYAIASPIVITGLDPYGAVITENLTLTATGGGETIAGTKSFAQVTQIDIPAMTDTGGAFTFGVGDILLPSGNVFREVRGNSAANVKVGFIDGTSDTIPCTAGEHHKVAANRVYNTGTTVSSVTVYA